MQIPISPLKLNAGILDIVFRLKDSADYLEGIVVGGGAIPMMGASAPLNLLAALAQSSAEAIAAFITVKLLDPRVPANATAAVFPFDLRHAVPSLGTPEAALLRLASAQVAEAIFGFRMAGTLAAMGMPLDPQTMVEKANNTLIMALAGTRVFIDAGMTPMDELFSLEQVVLDREIVAWVRRVVEGFPWTGGAAQTLSTIRNGVTEGNFFTDEATLGHREVYWESELFRYTSLAHRLSDDRTTVAQRARDIVDQTVQSHTFELPADARREIDRIYRAAEQALL